MYIKSNEGVKNITFIVKCNWNERFEIIYEKDKNLDVCEAVTVFIMSQKSTKFK